MRISQSEQWMRKKRGATLSKVPCFHKGDFLGLCCWDLVNFLRVLGVFIRDLFRRQSAACRWLCWVFFCSWVSVVHASGGGAPAGGPGAVYVNFKPPLVTNFGGPGRLKYLKADMSIRVESSAVADAVQTNMPLIRNNLLNLMARQTDETMNGQAGKEAMRQEALKEIQSIVKTEAHMEGVLDVYFNSVLVQK
jgi:flagellar protein FliL